MSVTRFAICQDRRHSRWLICACIAASVLRPAGESRPRKYVSPPDARGTKRFATLQARHCVPSARYPPVPDQISGIAYARTRLMMSKARAGVRIRRLNATSVSRSTTPMAMSPDSRRLARQAIKMLERGEFRAEGARHRTTDYRAWMQTRRGSAPPSCDRAGPNRDSPARICRLRAAFPNGSSRRLSTCLSFRNRNKWRHSGRALWNDFSAAACRVHHWLPLLTLRVAGAGLMCSKLGGIGARGCRTAGGPPTDGGLCACGRVRLAASGGHGWQLLALPDSVHRRSLPSSAPGVPAPLFRQDLLVATRFDPVARACSRRGVAGKPLRENGRFAGSGARPCPSHAGDARYLGAMPSDRSRNLEGGLSICAKQLDGSMQSRKVAGSYNAGRAGRTRGRHSEHSETNNMSRPIMGRPPTTRRPKVSDLADA